MFYTDDPVSDFERYDADQQKRIEQLPICEDCGDRVMDDHYYLINDEVICPDCIEAYRKNTMDFFE